MIEKAMSVELSFEFEGAVGQRLVEAERLLRWLVQIHSSAVNGLDVAYAGPRRTLFAFVRLDGRRFGPRDEQRIRFWAARSCGRVRKVTDIPPGEWARLQGSLSRCDVRAIAVQPAEAPRAVTTIATAAGLDAAPRSFAEDRPTLTIDICGPGWDAVRWDETGETLFIAAPLSPPLGDPIPVSFSASGQTRVALEWLRVVEVRSSEEAAPGRPAGFALGLATAPRDLRRQLSRSAPTAHGSRAAPRYPCVRPLEPLFP